MKLGILSDIHADLGALEKALELLEHLGAEKVLCAGDLVEKGDQGDEVVSLLRSLWIPSVCGNHDLNALRHGYMHHPQKTVDAPLSNESLGFLATLPPVLRYEWEGQRIVVVHEGSPICGESLSLYHSPKRFKRLISEAHADFLILGHLHTPILGRFQGCVLLHPGSVCSGRSRDSHTCAILHLPKGPVEVFDIASRKQTNWMHLW
ncbi:MAG: metallophosphoesterase family protein [Myxococcales bacterium]|nr:metallophosphoesterase family protein [Myxococcales bacterium]MCB9642366.1 metallophosphoesterase family protein [Myxococcales bacterium]